MDQRLISYMLNKTKKGSQGGSLDLLAKTSSQECIHGFPLDNMTHLGEGLLCWHHANPSQSLIVYKSDVADAYCLLPMHPLWQIKQIIMIDGEWDVDRNNCFGGCGLPGIYISFNRLMTWIAKRIILIDNLWTYMDDSFGIDEEENLTWYHKYKKDVLVNQVKLLSLWDELGIPHQPHKQLFGTLLTIIGIYVNPNGLIFALPKQALEELLQEIDNFTFWSEKSMVPCGPYADGSDLLARSTGASMCSLC